MKNKILTTSENPDVNYLAQVVELKEVTKHPNADKLQLTTVSGSEVITGLSAKPGDIYIYFPIECQIEHKFLCWSNSYSDSERNQDINKKGMFNKQGRVRMAKIRGVFSNGYIVPVSELERYIQEFYGETIQIDQFFVGASFDSITVDGKSDRFVKKYVRHYPEQSVRKQKTKGNIKKYESKLVEDQFRFHESTVNLRKEVAKVSPVDYISISNKIHGANFVVSKVLVKKKLSLVDKIAKYFGANIKDSEYGNLYSSRSVLKNSNFYNGETPGFYDTDIWKIVSDRLYPLLDDGISVYGEVFGFTPTGKYIQPGYDYGCPPKELDFVVFKVTVTLPDGNCYVMNHPQMVAYCEKKGIKMPECYYYGRAGDLFPDLDTHNHWHENFLKRLEEKYLEKDCHLCKGKVPAEGVCISRQVPHQWDCLKLKSKNFLMGESITLDSSELSAEELIGY
jgi:tRNA-binding EMAP/Myf-like protein